MLLGGIVAVIVVAAAIALIGFGITVSRQGTSEDLGVRLERYGSRDYMGQLDEGLNRRAPGRIAQVVDRAVAERSFTGNIRTRLARADLRLTVGEWLILRGVITFGGGVGILVGGLSGRAS